MQPKRFEGCDANDSNVTTVYIGVDVKDCPPTTAAAVEATTTTAAAAAVEATTTTAAAVVATTTTIITTTTTPTTTQHWRRVRHVPQGSTWHPATDDLMLVVKVKHCDLT